MTPGEDAPNESQHVTQARDIVGEYGNELKNGSIDEVPPRACWRLVSFKWLSVTLVEVDCEFDVKVP